MSERRLGDISLHGGQGFRLSRLTSTKVGDLGYLWGSIAKHIHLRFGFTRGLINTIFNVSPRLIVPIDEMK